MDGQTLRRTPFEHPGERLFLHNQGQDSPTTHSTEATCPITTPRETSHRCSPHFPTHSKGSHQALLPRGTEQPTKRRNRTRLWADHRPRGCWPRLDIGDDHGLRLALKASLGPLKVIQRDDWQGSAWLDKDIKRTPAQFWVWTLPGPCFLSPQDRLA